MKSKRITVVGAGVMGTAILESLIARGHAPDSLRATTRTAESAATLRERGIDASTDNLSATEGAEIVIFSVKPMSIRQVASAIATEGRLASGALIVSIAAGVRSSVIEEAMESSNPVIRAMPNLPCAIGRGMTVLSRGSTATSDHVTMARAMFEPMGRVAELEEKHMDTVTGLSASGPAFFYVIIEALADGAVARGLPRNVAIEMAAQIAYGAGSMVLETGRHPAALKDEVTTPAGCTIAGILALEDGRIRSVMSRAVEVASIRAGELGGD